MHDLTVRNVELLTDEVMIGDVFRLRHNDEAKAVCRCSRERGKEALGEEEEETLRDRKREALGGRE